MKKRKNSGITLIALVITIIVLLILAGISIATLTGDNGILTQTNKAKNQTEIAGEKEKIELAMVEENAFGTESTALGKELYDKTMENGAKWDVIVLNQTNKTYGSGWNYIEKGNNLGNNETAKYNWLVNCKTGEIIRLEDNSYVNLNYNEALGVADGLIFSLDPSVIDSLESEDLEAQYKQVLGENTELINFNWNEESGLTKSSFNFDGVDDYIKVEYNNAEGKQTLAENGFTFEFYGILDGGTSYNASKEMITTDYKGIFCYWTGRESQQAGFRFGMKSGKRILWNAGYGNYESDYAPSTAALWNISYPEIEGIEPGKEIYFTITLDCSNSYQKEENEYYTHTVYANGKKIYEGGFNQKTWQSFLENTLDVLKYFCIGRSSMTENGWWHYSKMNAYAIRLYNRGLNESEVTNNYQKSVAYHEALSK